MDVKGIASMWRDRWTLDNEGPIFKLFMIIVRMWLMEFMVKFLERGYMTAFVIIFFICPTGSLGIQCHEAKIMDKVSKP